MITQGWYESDGNTMCFCQCGCSVTHVVNHLSNYVNMLQERKKTVLLNANAETFVYAKDMVMDNVTRTEEKEVEVKENEWKKMPIKGMQKSNDKNEMKPPQKGKKPIDFDDYRN